ncbi:zinc finger protein draculin-like [Sitodiplosis mosellana]|uniref:zinc finger protein draculin-like n=1 Tax=Sitodiplosis mosellana TaxID=263140 RepID=UPI0024437553|nr:zinc finger protein draculin-like [Sitodiplosis mosellana]
MEVICYVCNEQTDNWRRNFTELKSQHSNTPIVDLLKRFLDDFESQRNIESESNCICAKCLNRIDDYDCMCVLCAERETELKELLWATEKSHIYQATVLLPEPEYVLNPDAETVVPPKKIEIDADCEVKDEPIIESDTKLDPMADPISIENQPNKVWTIIEVVPTQQREPLSRENEISELPSKKQIIESNVNLGIIPADYKNSVFKHGWNPHRGKSKIPLISRSKIPLISRSNKTEIPAENAAAPKNSQPPNSKSKKPLTKRIYRTDVNAETLTESELNRYCAQCKFLFYKKTNHENHMKVHRRTCEFCGIRFSTYNECRAHLPWHKKQIALMCQICHLKLASEDEHRNHLKLHDGKSNLQCVICDKEYTNKWGLRLHTKNHGEPSVLCDLCGKSFYNRDRLKMHRRTHVVENLFKCSHCPKTFKAIDYLRVHEKIHTSTERPFACSVCDMRFKRKDHWKAHEKRHTENTKTVKCAICPAAYEHKFHLKQHMERRHGAERPQGTLEN